MNYLYLLATLLILQCSSLEAANPRDCYEVQQQDPSLSQSNMLMNQLGGPPETIVKTIYPHKVPFFTAMCDCQTDDGSWTVIQVREDTGETRLNFNRTYAEYSLGFGSFEGEFWLGLENIHALTNRVPMKLRVELQQKGGEVKVVNFEYFSVADADDKYRMTASGNNCDLGESLLDHSGKMFSAFDSDNDLKEDTNCASRYGGGWWFNEGCYSSNLNGDALNVGDKGGGINWFLFGGFKDSLVATRMMIKPAYENPESI